MNKDPILFHVDRLELTFAPKDWAYAREKRTEIDAYFAELKRQKPAVWNGRVLLMHRQVVSEGVFRGTFFETDYASFSAWRSWGYPPADAHDCFAAGAIMSSDNAVLLGLMAEHTANAGCIYFPAGTPEPSDIVGGKVDFAGSVARELMEETGCDIGDFEVAPGWTVIVESGRIALIQTLRSRLSANELRARMLAHLAQDKHPELADIRVVRSRRDYEPGMLPFVIAFLEQHFADE